MTTQKAAICGAVMLILLAMAFTMDVQGGRVLMPLFGGTGTSAKFTAGSIPFSASSTTGAYRQDAADFNYNATTHVLTATGGLASSGPVDGTNGTFSGVLSKTGANGQSVAIKALTEETTIAAGANTDTALTIPANAIVLAVPVRVTTLIPTATNFTVTGATSGTAFQTGASVAVAKDTTDAGTKTCPYLNAAAQKVRITPDQAPAGATGKVRVTVYYIEVTAPAS